MRHLGMIVSVQASTIMGHVRYLTLAFVTLADKFVVLRDMLLG